MNLSWVFRSSIDHDMTTKVHIDITGKTTLSAAKYCVVVGPSGIFKALSTVTLELHTFTSLIAAVAMVYPTSRCFSFGLFSLHPNANLFQ